MDQPLRYSIVVPVFNEAENVSLFCARARAELPPGYELLICYDSDDDSTLPALAALPADRKPERIRLIRNSLGAGVRYAIEAGMRAAAAPVVVVMMVDLSDDFSTVDEMVRRVENGADVVCASRYMPGGAQIGGPRLKGWLSRAAGLSLHYLAGLPVRDPTNSFKAYSRKFLNSHPIESIAGFCLGLELTVKAHFLGGRVEEVPATWTDRTTGQSRFRLWTWMPHYIRWYWWAILEAHPLVANMVASCARAARMVRRLVIPTVCSLFVIHLLFVWVYGVDIPFWDEWNAFLPGALTARFPGAWIVERHNEHAIVFSKLLIWLLYRFDGWNLITSQIVSFLLFGGFLFALFRFGRWTVPDLPGWMLAAFLVFLVSTTAHENHAWGFQSSFHFVNLFFILAVGCLFDPEQRPSRLLAGTLLAISSCYSFSSGVAAVAVLLAGFVCFKFGRIYRARKSDRANNMALPAETTQFSREVGQLIVAVPIGLTLALWVWNLPHPSYHPAPSLFNEPNLLPYFLTLISSGFGAPTAPLAIGTAFLLLTISPLILQMHWSFQGHPLTERDWALMTSIGGTLAALAAVAIGRSGINLRGAQFSRYAELSFLLVPLTALAWAHLLRSHVNIRNLFLLALWACLFIAYRDDWNFNRCYRSIARTRVIGRECFRESIRSGSEANCPTVFPFRLSESQVQLLRERLNELNVSFYRTMKSADGQQ